VPASLSIFNIAVWRPLATLLLVAIVGQLSTLKLRAQDLPAAIYVMKPDGSQVRQVVEVTDFVHANCQRWSHDGKRIAFDAHSPSRNTRVLFVVNVDGSQLRELPGTARPDWSPDDKQLVFDKYSNAPSEVHVQNLDGEGRTSLTQGVCGRWSPDGSQMAFTDHKMLYTLDVVSGEEKPLFDEPFVELFAGFNWSPDGKWLALSARPRRGVPRQLLIVSAQGARHGLRVRFENEQGGTISFSPDGKQLVFDNAYKIFIADVEGTKDPRMLDNQPGKNQDPRWSPDGQWILFSSDR
jgi:Tol biopolymer transport system component